MIEIKFRGKRVDNGEWVYGGILQHEGYTAICVHSDYHQWHEFIEVDPKTVGQYIGFNDRDDREIYQGDIVAVDCDCDPGDYATCSHDPNLNIVIWDQTEASFSFRGIMFRADDMHTDYTDMWDAVGNVYDNPELLAPKEGADTE